jgi:hypothetical protein
MRVAALFERFWPSALTAISSKSSRRRAALSRSASADGARLRSLLASSLMDLAAWANGHRPREIPPLAVV